MVCVCWGRNSAKTYSEFKPSAGQGESKGILGAVITGQSVPPHSPFPTRLVTVHPEKDRNGGRVRTGRKSL